MTLNTFTASTAAVAAEVDDNFKALKLHQVYTGTTFDSGVATGGASDEQSVELTAISASDLGEADYLQITIVGVVDNRSSGSGTAQVQIKIQTREIAGSYSDSMAYKNLSVALNAANDTGVRSLTYMHTLTSGEKTNGVQVKVFSQSSTDASGTKADFDNLNTIVRSDSA